MPFYTWEKSPDGKYVAKEGGQRDDPGDDVKGTPIEDVFERIERKRREDRRDVLSWILRWGGIALVTLAGVLLVVTIW